MTQSKSKIVGFFLAVLGVLSLVSCTGKNSGTEKVSESSIKVGFVLATLNEERYAKDRAYFEEAAKELGATVEFASCDDKVSRQTAKVETLLAKGVNVLVIQPVNSEAASSLVTIAKRDGVPVIAYDRIIRNADIELYVTQNSFQVGVLQAEAAVEATGGKGNYVILMGEAGHSVADEITRGNLSVLSKYPGIQVVVKQNHPGWSTALALSTVENSLTRYKNNISAVLANNDGMALGAIQALEEQKLAGKVFVAGADADLAAIKDVLKGRQSMTVLKGIKPLAQAAARAAVSVAQGKAISTEATLFNGKKEVPVLNTPVEKVVKENVESVIVDSGFHSRESVFGKSTQGE